MLQHDPVAMSGCQEDSLQVQMDRVDGENVVQVEEQQMLLFAPTDKKEDRKLYAAQKWLQAATSPFSKTPMFAVLAFTLLLLICGKTASPFVSHRQLMEGVAALISNVPTKSGLRIGWSADATQQREFGSSDQPGLAHPTPAEDQYLIMRGTGNSQSGVSAETSDIASMPRLAIPLLNIRVGAGNQLIEFSSIALFARVHNFSLCMPHLYHGPAKHSAHFPPTWRQKWGYAFEELFNLTELARFVRLKPMEECIETCGGNLTGFVEFRETRGYDYDNWTPPPLLKKHCCKNWSFLQWRSVNDLVKGQHIPNGCISMGSIFPGLTWRGSYLALYAFLRPSMDVEMATDLLVQSLLSDRGGEYMAVHWRFEESSACMGQGLGGLCFLRCPHGVIVADSDIPPHFSPNASRVPPHYNWTHLDNRHCPPNRRHLGVIVTGGDIAAALVETAQAKGLNAIYLSSDGWIRGEDSCSTMQQVVMEVQRQGIRVVGLWQCPGFYSQFADGTNVTFAALESLYSNLNTTNAFQIGSQALNVIEQEVCVRAHTFMGSGPSSWSLSVWRTRVAHRKRASLAKSLIAAKTYGSGWEEGELDDQIITELLEDHHMAGMVCANSEARKNDDHILIHDFVATSGPELWLDYMACEARQHKLSQCQVGACW